MERGRTRETHTDEKGNKTTVRKGDQFFVRGFLNGKPHVSAWEVCGINGYDLVTSMITALDTHTIKVKLIGGEFVDTVSREVEKLKPGDEVDFCADSVVDLLREERERNKTSRKRNNSQASPIGIVHV